MWPWSMCGTRGSAGHGGFTLVEVLVATALFSSGLVAVAQLTVLVSRSNVASRDTSASSLFSSQKLNELSTDELASIVLSSPDAWMREASATTEYLDSAGTVVPAVGSPPGNAVYIRRWSVTPLVADVTGGVVIQVSTERVRRRLLDGLAADALPLDAARVIGIRMQGMP